MISLELIKEIIIDKVGNAAIIREDENSTPAALIIDPSVIIDVCNVLYQNDQLYFDFLSSVTGLDNGIEENTMEVIYNLYSITNDTSLMLKVIIPRDTPKISSISGIWRGADWQERETYDLLGIVFDGHPDLRRILLPNDWEGHPLRKDYQEQAYYHGITVKYEFSES